MNRHYGRLVFTTEGHILPVDWRFREWPGFLGSPGPKPKLKSKGEDDGLSSADKGDFIVTVTKNKARNASDSGPSCPNFAYSRRYILPLESRYLKQLYQMIGVEY